MNCSDKDLGFCYGYKLHIEFNIIVKTKATSGHSKSNYFIMTIVIGI